MHLIYELKYFENFNQYHHSTNLIKSLILALTEQLGKNCHWLEINKNITDRISFSYLLTYVFTSVYLIKEFFVFFSFPKVILLETYLSNKSLIVNTEIASI